MNYILLVFVFLISGCMGGGALRDMHLSSIPKHEKFTSYKIGQIQEKKVGDAMITVVDGWVIDGFIAVKEYQQPPLVLMGIPIIYPPIKINSEWFYKGKTDSGDIVYSPYVPLLPTVSGSPAQWEYCIVSNAQNEFYGFTSCHWISIQEWPEKIPDLLKPSKIYKEGSYKQELIYNGKSKDMIKLQYREYKNDMARPAFYQDLIYDLSDSNLIGFKGLNIEVIEATNLTISFIVKTPMN
jgi:hypothetical protein